jgi:sporulation protein YlmC with PRC-barrel domain
MMKRVITVAILGCGALLSAAPAVRADEPRDKKDPLPRIFKLSGLEAMNVFTKGGEPLGKISDAGVNTRDGTLTYMVLSHGGTLGVGAKLFAVPPSALTMGPLFKGQPNENVFVLDIDKAKLDADPGFKKEAPPSEPSAIFAPAKPEKDKEAKPEKEARVDKERDLKKDETSTVILASELEKMSVKNPKAEDLGKIADFMVDVDKHRIVYAGVSFGGTLGVGAKLFAVPWSAFDMKALTGDPKNVSLVLDVDKATLTSTEGFNAASWPLEANEKMFKGSGK